MVIGKISLSYPHSNGEVKCARFRLIAFWAESLSWAESLREITWVWFDLFQEALAVAADHGKELKRHNYQVSTPHSRHCNVFTNLNILFKH